MRMDYTLLDPTGNRTLLVTTPVAEPRQPALAAALMAAEPGTEQVGFFALTEEGFSLRMAGGEFCGNASLCAAVMTARARGKTRLAVAGRVLGAASPVYAEVEALPADTWRGTVDMPRPLRIEEEALPGGRFPVVRFPGISHVILRETLPREKAEALAPVWCAALKAEALGLLFFDEDAQRLTPLVYVPGAGTLCWESSCASGSTAVGAYLAALTGEKQRLTLCNPGGSLTVEAAPAGRVRLTGRVRLVKEAAMDV